MIKQTDLVGSFTLPGTSMTVHRMGYGAMQLAGPEVFGSPRDVDAAITGPEALIPILNAIGLSSLPTTIG
jgi:hypothetical protein